MTKGFLKTLVFGALAVLMVVAVAGCSLIEGDDDSDGDSSNGGATNGSGNASGVVARQVVFTTDIGALPARGIVPQAAREIRAVVSLEGVEAGMQVTARWYQTGTANVGPEGQEISSRDLTLTAQEVNPDGTTFANFVLASQSGFPEDAWLLRVYVNGELVRTSAFVITAAANNAQPATQPQPTPTGAPAAEPTNTPTP